MCVQTSCTSFNNAKWMEMTSLCKARLRCLRNLRQKHRSAHVCVENLGKAPWPAPWKNPGESVIIEILITSHDLPFFCHRSNGMVLQLFSLNLSIRVIRTLVHIKCSSPFLDPHSLGILGHGVYVAHFGAPRAGFLTYLGPCAWWCFIRIPSWKMKNPPKHTKQRFKGIRNECKQLQPWPSSIY